MISPPSCITSRCTRSSPTPRPALASACWRVEMPGMNNIARTARRSRASRSVSNPASIAQRRTASTSTPAPSSNTTSFSLAASTDAVSRNVARAGFEWASRMAGASTPCVTALRTSCNSGLDQALGHPRGTSTSSPCRTTTSSFPSLRASVSAAGATRSKSQRAFEAPRRCNESCAPPTSVASSSES